MKKSYKVLFVLIFVLLILENEVLATKHVVGGSQGWDPSVDFDSWISSKTFKVGDELVFKYNSGLHSVVELRSESAYKSCELGTIVDSKNSGNDVVKVNKPGTRYFACGTLGHCDQGMKVKIKIVSVNAPSSPASSSSASSSTCSRFRTNYCLEPFVGFFMIVAILCVTCLQLFTNVM